MPKFNYRLQTVLNLKKQMENNAKNELAIKTKKLDSEEKILKEIKCEKENCFESIISENDSVLNIIKLRQYEGYLSLINNKEENQKENIVKAKQDVNEYRDRLIHVSKQKKVLEKLRERKFKEYLYDKGKEEEKTTDEVVTYKYSSNSKI